MFVCKECGCQIVEDFIPNRTGYYCQQCGEDKQKYEVEEITEFVEKATKGEQLKSDIIDLINHKDEEIERLEDKLEEKSSEIKTLIASIDRLMKVNKQEVIEHLKKINFNAFPKEVLNAIKSEAYKELAGELKTKVNLDLCEAINCSDYLYDLPKLIDNLVKEKIDYRE